jgi:inosine/xanthosine triphosphate pyrophosphatase family protein
MPPITFITSNPNKLLEVTAILPNTISLTHRALDIPEIQGSLEEIAIAKCRRAAEIVRLPSFTAPSLPVYTNHQTERSKDQSWSRTRRWSFAR